MVGFGARDTFPGTDPHFRNLWMFMQRIKLFFPGMDPHFKNLNSQVDVHARDKNNIYSLMLAFFHICYA